MISSESWQRRNSPMWGNYKYIPSIEDRDICCLALDYRPSVGHFYMSLDSLDLYYKNLLVESKDHENVVDRFSDENLMYIETHYSCLFKILFKTDELLPYPEVFDHSYYSFDHQWHREKFLKDFQGKVLSEDGWDTLQNLKESSLKDIIHELLLYLEIVAFQSSYKEMFNTIQENRVENGGHLEYVNGTNKIRFVDFSSWAERIGLPLPDGFPLTENRSQFDPNELKQSNMLITELLLVIKKLEGKKYKQGALAEEIAAKKIKGLGKRTIDGIFGAVNKKSDT